MNKSSDSRRSTVTRNAIGVGLATGLYGISFGALAVTSGFSFAQAQVLSLGLFSGASQFAVVGIMGAGGGALAAIATSSLLGIRNGLYALSLARVLKLSGIKKVFASHITIDESTAMSVANVDDEELSRWAFWATGISVFVFWNIATAIGAIGASLITDPKSFGLDAAVGAAFLALLWPRLINKQIRYIALSSALLAIILIPVVRPGLPVLASVLIAVIIGLRNSGSK
ncbi:MAG: AzlC family ABC transporter permease [Candidatus Nanopelagicales bacterium]|jgi:4-azaleucine resistance transporter AzlC|nr:AzlC family ABC transporter permease [Candidatus Nanopelagicales bacterium]